MSYLMSEPEEPSLDECVQIIAEKLGRNKARIILLQIRRKHNKALFAQHGGRPSCSAASAAMAMEGSIRALAGQLVAGK